jgi:hypothetical protein
MSSDSIPVARPGSVKNPPPSLHPYIPGSSPTSSLRPPEDLTVFNRGNYVEETSPPRGSQDVASEQRFPGIKTDETTQEVVEEPQWLGQIYGGPGTSDNGSNANDIVANQTKADRDATLRVDDKIIPNTDNRLRSLL